ncbi:tetratricopeptide repeat protein, partial [Candidatus Falkowbacteria bacterium]|nr:tetratricopeptide repeat protein [Candidatus Falkowbacteria bacterium]
TAEEYAQLAAFYAKIGQNQNAIAATNEAIKIDPNFRDDGEKFLKLLETGELLNNEQN